MSTKRLNSKTMKTYNRAKLRREVEKGLVTMVGSYSFDDMLGVTRTGVDQEMVVRMHPDGEGAVTEGTVYVWESDFRSPVGRAVEAGKDSKGRQLVALRIHSNSNMTLAINDRPVRGTHDAMKRFRMAVPKFQRAIVTLADFLGLSVSRVMLEWDAYANTDQSALLSEFVDFRLSALDVHGRATREQIEELVVAPFYRAEAENVVDFKFA